MLLGGGHVEGRFDFARTDASVLARRDDAAGTVDLRDAVLHAIDVSADGDACAPGYAGESAAGADGVEVRATFECPHRPGALAVSLPLLDELGASHVHRVHLVGGGHESSVELRSSRASAALVVGGAPASRSRANATEIVLVLAALGGAVATWRTWKSKRKVA